MNADHPFALLGLAPELLNAVADLGFTTPTAVQSQAIPLALHDPDAHTQNDLMVSSQTGSGKTAAFLLPVLHTLLSQQQAKLAEEQRRWAEQVAAAEAAGEPLPKRARRKDPTNPRNFKPAVPGALVLCPTRELAMQAECLVFDDQADPPFWRLRVERESLRQSGLQDKLQAALSTLVGKPARLEIEAGRASDSPALRDTPATRARQRQAEAIILEDPEVQLLLSQFKTARILPGSIKPL